MRNARYVLHVGIAVLLLTGKTDHTAAQPVAARPGVGKPVRVVSLSFKAGASVESIAAIVDSEGAKGADLIVLPEAWRGNDIVEPLSGPTITAMSGLAQKHHCYVVCPIYREDHGHRLNSSVLIDRTGNVVSIYDKIYPYWNEFDMTPPALPGQQDAGIYDADFGRMWRLSGK